MKHLTIYELNESQLKEAKARLYEEQLPEGVGASYGELANVDELITDREVWEAYRNTFFVAEDFAADTDEPNPNKYRLFCEAWQKKSNEFLSKNAFFAFNKEQFADGLAKFNCTEAEAPERFAQLLGGCYILRDKKAEYVEMIRGLHEEQRKLMQNPLFAFKAFLFELENHEFCYTGDTEDALDALAMDYAEDIAPDEMLKAVLQDAIKAASGTEEPAEPSADILAAFQETPKTIKGSLGLVTATAEICDKTAADPELFAEVTDAIKKYCVMDWGDTSEDDKPLNDDAANEPETDRILAAYNTKAGRIFIITEYDRSRTTVLFASEY